MSSTQHRPFTPGRSYIIITTLPLMQKQAKYKRSKDCVSMIRASSWNILRVTGPLWRESTGHRWIPSRSPAELWRFLWSAPEQTVQTIETLVIWDAIGSLWRDCKVSEVFRLRHHAEMYKPIQTHRKYPIGNDCNLRHWNLSLDVHKT